MKKWSSFAVKSPTEIIHEASHPMGGDRESFSPSPMISSSSLTPPK